MPEFHYCNPITRGPDMAMRDHCMIRIGDRWYMTGTSHPIWKGANPGEITSNENDPGVTASGG